MTDFENYLDGLLDKLGLSHIKGTWEDQWIEGQAGKLYVPVFPAGPDAPTVVFIPGTSVYALCYAELLYGLMREGINVVGFDPRGQGRSGGLRGDYTIMGHVEDAKSACAYARERFGGPVFVMGSSQGGIEAFYLAATDEPVAGCICHNIADLTDDESIRLTRFGPRKAGKKINQGEPLPRIAVLSAQAGIQTMSAVAKLFPLARIPIQTYLDLRKEPMRVFGNAWNFIAQDPHTLKAITVRAMSSIADTQLPKPVPEIKTPVMVLHSSGDNIFPEDYIIRLYEQLTCDKAIKIYPDLPHLITIEHVPEILPDIVEWIKLKSS